MLADDINSFDDGRFKQKICELFEPKCKTGNVRDIVKQAGSTRVDFTIRFVHGGPTIPHMRERLVDEIHLNETFGSDFTLLLPHHPTLTEQVVHESHTSFVVKLGLIKAGIIVQVLLVLLGLWGLVVFWTITARGEKCRGRAHRGWRANVVPSANTLQVFVLSCFVQLIVAFGLHFAANEAELYPAGGEYNVVVLVGIATGLVGTIFRSLFNSWIRGESASLRAALSVDKIDKKPEWMDDGDERDYRQIYEAGGMRTLGQLAAHSWEAEHLSMEKKHGLFDMSEQVFDEIKPEKDPSLLASFLNSTILNAFGGKKGAQGPQGKPMQPEELRVVPVEVPPGLPKEMLRDAMLQWRMRHAAHPRELDAVDWLLGQLDPGFDVIAVKVPEQARLMLVEAMTQHAQHHAELQLDACHAVSLQSL